MDVVELTRKTLRESYDLEKVYLLYLDEIKHVHWHLVSRYDEEGFNLVSGLIPRQLAAESLCIEP